MAFAVSLAHGVDHHMFYNQSRMRQHIYHCLCAGRLDMFPAARISKRSSGIADTQYIDIHCYCGMPELARVSMIECTECNRWYHCVCCGGDVPQECMDTTGVQWLCKNCT